MNQNSETYVISTNVQVPNHEVQLVRDNRSRSGLTMTNHGISIISFGFRNETGINRGIELHPGQTVTITEQYDGDFGRVELVAVSQGETCEISVYQLIRYTGGSF